MGAGLRPPVAGDLGASWLVALVFAVMGGVVALVAGLVVATFVLLHDSAAKVLPTMRLDGELRSRRCAVPGRTAG